MMLLLLLLLLVLLLILMMLVYPQVRIIEGMYSVFVEDWLRIFRRDQIMFIRNEDYSEDIEGHIIDTFDFLQVGQCFHCHKMFGSFGGAGEGGRCLSTDREGGEEGALVAPV